MPTKKKEEAPQSIVHPQLKGTILISGLWGAGKTTLGLTLEHPELVVMLDFDQKSKARAEALGIEYYAPSTELSDPTEYDRHDIYQWAKETFEGLPIDKTTLFIDNGSYLEDAFHYRVAKNPEKYGVKRGNVASGAFGGTNPGVSKIWQQFIAYLTGHLDFERVVIAMHMSEQWAQGAPIGKYKVKGNKVLTQLANLSLVLSRATSPNTPPRAIVGKEALGLVTFDSGEFKTYMALPPAIPRCTWPEVYRLMDEAPERGDEFLTEELPTVKERERYSPWMTDEQKELILSIARNPKFGMSEEAAGDLVKEQFNDWADVIKAAITHKGYHSEKAVREAAKPIYEKGMEMVELYHALPDA